MTANQYKIETMQDILDCTNNDNLDNFITDLKNYIIMVHKLQSLANALGERQGTPEDKSKIKHNEFIWIDDGNYDYSIVFKPKL